MVEANTRALKLKAQKEKEQTYKKLSVEMEKLSKKYGISMVNQWIGAQQRKKNIKNQIDGLEKELKTIK